MKQTVNETDVVYLVHLISRFYELIALNEESALALRNLFAL